MDKGRIFGLKQRIYVCWSEKLELIMWISVLNDKNILDSLLALKQKTAPEQPSVRRAGWAKNLIFYVAPDFDETPLSFEEYMPQA